MNKSQENWPDVQLSLSTATPSLGGALPKLATLKINYEVPRYNYGRKNAPSSTAFFSRSSAIEHSIMPSMIARYSLDDNSGIECDDEQTQSAINVLATQTEASMSSTSFNIPRRSTIDSDVSLSFFCFVIYNLFIFI